MGEQQAVLSEARWQDRSGRGTEHLVLSEIGDAIVAEAAVLAEAGGVLFAARYRIACDRAWRVSRVEIGLIGDDRTIELASDGAGHWSDAAGTPLPGLDGAIDVDLTITPFTNTLPIRRLGLRAGQSAEILVVYVDFPHLTVTREPQRYACLEPGRRYRFETIDGDFVRDLHVDEHGLVLTYPGLFRRLA